MKGFIAAVAALAGLLLFAFAYGQMGMGGGRGMMGGSILRHQFVMRHGIDPKYANKANPFRPSAEDLAVGRKLYEADCAGCHGETGLGDGKAGKALNPPPANLAAASRMPMTSDAYLYWTIAEGGVALHTAMPPFKDVLKDEEIWKIILYLRRL